MSILEMQLSLIQKILQTFDEGVLELLEKTLLTSQKPNSTKPTTWENCGATLREMTPEEAKAVAEFEANPQIATREEVIELEKELGIKLNFN